MARRVGKSNVTANMHFGTSNAGLAGILHSIAIQIVKYGTANGIVNTSAGRNRNLGSIKVIASIAVKMQDDRINTTLGIGMRWVVRSIGSSIAVYPAQEVKRAG